MMADITRPEYRAKGMGMIGAAFGLGLVLGPMLGGLLSAARPGFAFLHGGRHDVGTGYSCRGGLPAGIFAR